MNPSRIRISLIKRLLWSLILMLALPASASAFCIINQSSATVHVHALNTSAFEAHMAPGDQTCCRAPGCVRNGVAQLLAVTGYVPVGSGNRPGWKAECRGRVALQGELLIQGNRNRIRCHRP